MVRSGRNAFPAGMVAILRNMIPRHRFARSTISAGLMQLVMFEPRCHFPVALARLDSSHHRCPSLRTASTVTGMSEVAADRCRLHALSKNLAMRFAGRIAVILNGMLGAQNRHGAGILLYHRMVGNIPGVSMPLDNVDPSRFREQIGGLLDRGFHFWPLSRLIDHHRTHTPVPPRTVIITFDDGFASVYCEAYAVLRELRVPATVFLVTGHLGGNLPFPFDKWGFAHQDCVPHETYRPLTIEQCREMCASGLVEMGAHTHRHADHRDNPEAFCTDVQRSADIIRKEFGKTPVLFAFPWGSPHMGFVSEPLLEAARQTGVICGLTTEPVLVDPASDPFCWGRFNVFPWDTSATLSAKLSGWYSWAPKLNKRLGRVAKAALCPHRRFAAENTSRNGHGGPT